MKRPAFYKLVDDTSDFITSGMSTNGKSFTHFEKWVIFMIWASGNQSYAHTAFGLGTGFSSIAPVITQVIQVGRVGQNELILLSKPIDLGTKIGRRG